MVTVLLGVAMFAGVVLSLVALLMVAKARLVAGGEVRIGINGDPDNAITVRSGGHACWEHFGRPQASSLPPPAAGRAAAGSAW